MTNRHDTVAPNFAERLERRRKQIELVLRLEFSGSNAPPPTPSLRADAATLAKAELHREWFEQRKAAQGVRRAELLKLTDDQLKSLAEERWDEYAAQERARREKQTPNACEPEWQFWIRRSEEWQLFEAALLLVNLEPRKGLGQYLKGILRGEYDYGDYDEIRLTAKTREAMHAGEALSDTGRAKLKEVQEIIRLARIARRRNTLANLRDDSGREVIEPGKFLSWARGRGYGLPPPLAKLIDEQPQAAKRRSPAERAAQASAAKRRGRNVERDRRIHDLRDAGKPRKEISRATGLSDSQIGRVLGRPRP